MVGVACLITFKALEILFYTPWALYITFWVEKPHGLSGATPGSFIYSRFADLLMFILMPVPVFALIVKVMEWTGDYLVLAFLLATTLVEMVIIWLYPKVINPLMASTSPLPEKHASLRCAIQGLAG